MGEEGEDLKPKVNLTISYDRTGQHPLWCCGQWDLAPTRWVVDRRSFSQR